MRDPAGRRGQRGFSLIEVLIALAMLFVIAMMLMPLFSQSMVLNLAGREYGVAANFVRSGQEELTQVDYHGTRLGVTAGTEGVDEAFWVARAPDFTVPDGVDVERTYGEWVGGGDVGSATPLWEREIRVRQFSVGDVQDDFSLDDPMPAGTDPQFVHLKEIRIAVEGAREGGPLGPARGLVVTRVRAF